MSQISSYCPRVCVIWTSGFRADYLIELATDFLGRTDYPNLRTLVIDWGISNPEDESRRRLITSGVFDQVILRNQKSCKRGNLNFAFDMCKDEFIIQLEDDVRLKRNIPKAWLAEIVQRMTHEQLDDFCLWQPNATFPSSLASISTQESIRRQTPFPQHPEQFKTISESLRRADGLCTLNYKTLGLKCNGASLVETSMSIPSYNLNKLAELRSLPFVTLDKMSDIGVRLIRRNDVDWVDFNEYRDLGGWETCEFLRQQPDDAPVLPRFHSIVLKVSEVGVTQKTFRLLMRSARRSLRLRNKALTRIALLLRKASTK